MSTTTTQTLPSDVQSIVNAHLAGKAGGSTKAGVPSDSIPIRWSSAGQQSDSSVVTHAGGVPAASSPSHSASRDKTLSLAASSSTATATRSSSAPPSRVTSRSAAAPQTTAASSINSQYAEPFEGHQQTWAGTGDDTVGSQAITARFEQATDVLRKLAKARSKAGSGSSLPDSLRTMQERERFTDSFIEDAATILSLSQKNKAFGKDLRSILKTGRKVKTDGYHRSVRDESQYKGTISQMDTYSKSGLKPEEETAITDILWRNDQTALRLLEKMSRKPQREEPAPANSNPSTQDLKRYIRDGYQIGEGGYEEETSQITADLSARIASKPASQRTARPEDLSSLQGHALITAIAELGWTLSEKYEMDVGEICAWGRQIPSVLQSYRSKYKKEKGLQDAATLAPDAESEIQESIKSLIYSNLSRREGWDLEDVESLMAMWSVKDTTALNMGLRSIVKNAKSKLERPIAMAKQELASVERALSEFDDPYKQAEAPVVRWR